MKKGIFLLSVILLLIVGWSAGWYYVVEKVETVIQIRKQSSPTKAEILNVPINTLMATHFASV